jgi:NAD(P)-dependent dehydrogenase (short-subunit alcohol dehydrogenase family)
MNNKKRTVLITGASSGIGKAIAEQLLNDGLTVYVAARRVEKMQDLEKRGAIALKIDVTCEDDMVNGINQIKAAHGGIDVLVNNAGYATYGAVEDTSIEDARRQFEVNLFGLARLTQLVLPYMREQRAGTIINMSSMGGKIYTPLGAWYHATKHALEGWSDCLRIELAPFGVDVIIVEPGAIETEFGDVMTAPLMERSGRGPYAALAKNLEKATREAYEDGKVSPPSVIADLVSQAVKANKPKTRYVGGYLAKPVMFMRHWLPDRWFDKIILNTAS